MTVRDEVEFKDVEVMDEVTVEVEDAKVKGIKVTLEGEVTIRFAEWVGGALDSCGQQ